MTRYFSMLLALLVLVSPLSGNSEPTGDGDSDKEHPHPDRPHKPGSDGKKRHERSLNGVYNLELRGYYRGTGTATVTENVLSINVKVTLSDGTTADLTANNIVIDGPFFNGRGRVKDQALTITGRLDAAKSSRLVGFYRSSSGQAGRFVGTLPSDSGDDKWGD